MSRTLSALRRCASFLPLFVAMLLAAVCAHAAPVLQALPTWSQLSPGTNPGARYGASMAYDGKELVLFGGTTGSAALGDTWLWNGATWTQVTGLVGGTTAPSARLGAMMAYDQKNGKLVLFGGIDGSNALKQDTWTWSSSTLTWTQASTTGVSARQLGSMVYDPNANGGTGAIILFGGNDAGGPKSDMYMWSGTAWTPLAPATLPPGRSSAVMVYDAAANNVVLFGGETGTVTFTQNNFSVAAHNELNDTWTWNGTNWTQVTGLAASPSNRFLSSAAYDPASGQMILTGGLDSSFTYLSDTWAWTGSAWVQAPASSAPGPHSGAAMAYDPATGNSILFSGRSSGAAFDTNTYSLQSAANMGTIAVGATGAGAGTSTVVFEALNGPVSFGTGGDSGGPAQIRTLGAPNQDFTLGSTTCSSATALGVNNTCTVTVTFSPKFAGARSGAVQLLDASGNILSTVLVYGNGTGPQAAFNPGAVSTLGSGFTGVYASVVDGNGNVFVASGGAGGANSSVQMMTPSCAASSTACATTLTTSVALPYQLALDGAGNLYIADSHNSAVKKITAGCTSSCTTTTLGGGFNHVYGVAVDGAGNVYVSDSFNNQVKVMPPNCTSASCVTSLGGGFNGPNGLAVDSSGNVYVADGNNNAVKLIPPGCASASCVTSLGGGFSFPYGVAVDPAGTVYVDDTNNNSVKMMSSSCTSSSCVTALGTGYNHPYYLSLDGSGNLYVGDFGNNAVKQLNRAAPPILAFPTATVAGTTDTTDGAKTVTLANIGNQALSFPIPGTGQQNPSISPDFTLTGTSSAGACPVLTDSAMAPGTLASAASCTAQVTFTPQAADLGSINGTLVFKDTTLNATSTTQLVPLSGTSYATPAITSITPTSGSSLGGTSVTITGTGFIGATAVSFGATPATTFTVNSDTSITATSPAGTGTVDVIVTNPATTSVTGVADQFTYVAYPTVTSVSPTSGTTTGGTTVTITGTNFTGVTGVAFGGTAATFTFNSTTSITATSPARSAGTVDVTVTTPSGTTATGAADLFTYVAAPTISAINPNAGPLAGGTSVTLTGTNFVAGNTTVTIGGATIPAGSVTVNSATSLTFTTPAHAIGSVNVTVSTVGGTSSAAIYTYRAAPGVTVQNVTAPVTSIVTLSATVTFVAGTAPTGAFSFTVGSNPTVIPATCSAASTSSETCTASYSLGITLPGTYTITGTIAADTNYTSSSNTGALTVGVLPTYLVTVLTDPATGTASKCVAGATGNGGGNASCSLRDALAATNALVLSTSSTGATINFLGTLASAATPGTVNITTGGTLAITEPVIINGLGANALQLTGNNAAQIMSVSGVQVTLTGLRFSAGKSSTTGGAVTVSGGTLTLNNDYFSNNVGGNGGAVSTDATSGLLTVTNTTFSANTATSGGALYTTSGSGGLSINNSTFSTNNGTAAGAIEFYGTSGTVKNSTFSGNTSSSEGALSAHAAIQVTNSIFVGNTTTAAGGGGISDAAAGVNASNNVYFNNQANGATDDCDSCNANTGPVSGNPNLGALANYGGTTPTMLPLPGSAAVCAGTVALSANSGAASNQVMADQRGLLHSSAYCSSTQLDAGAVQTSYTLGFTQNPTSQVSSGIAIVPAPSVTLLENGSGITGATVSMALATGTLGGTTTSTSTGTGLTTFSNLIVPAGVTGDTLIATLMLGNGAGAAQITATSTAFSSLAVGPATLTAGTVGVAFDQSFTTSNGTTPYTYSITSGALPAGLTLTAATGRLSGTPTAGGTFNFTVKVTDGNSHTAFTAYTLIIAAPTVIVTPTALPTLTFNSVFSQAFSTSGGTAPYTYTVSAGTLPTGLTLTTAGVLSGTPTAAGPYSFTVKSTDSSTGTGPYFGTVSFSGTVNKAVATVVLSNLNPTYNGSPQAPTVATGPAGLTVVLTYNGSTTTPTNAGTYAVVATINEANYQGSTTNTFIIAKAAATVTLGSLTQTYTGSPLSATATTTPTGLNVVFTYNGSTTPPTGAGTYTVVGTITETNYQGSATGTFTINKAVATVTLGSLTQTYTGSPLSATATTSPAGLTVNFTYNGSATPPTPAGTYTVIGTVSDANYVGTATGTLTINKAVASITLGNLTPTYTGLPIAATEKTVPAGLTVPLTYNGSSTAPTAAGSYTVVGTVVDPNYQGTTTATMVIGKATLTITAPTLTKVYGAPLPTLTGTYSGNVNNETFTVSVTTTATASSPVVVGGYPITPTVTGATLVNYIVVPVQGKLTITPATLTITAPNLSKAYGAVVPSLNGTYTGNVNGDTFIVTGSTPANSASPVVAGGYPITPSVTGTNLASYTVVAVPGVLTITPVTLTITAPTLSKVYGAPLPSLNGTYTGNVGNDTFTVTGTTTATATSPVVAGGYVITPTVSGPNLSSYTLVTVPGVLTITPATLTITAPTLSKAYGAPLPSLNGTYTGNVNGDTFTVTGSTAATAASPVVAGGYTITPTVTGPNLTNYTLISVPGVLTITPVTLTITAPTFSKAYGAPLPSLNGTYSGNVNGDTFTINGVTAATAASPVVAGGYPITPVAVGNNLSSYNIVAVPGVITITPATLTITAPTLSKTYGANLPSLNGSYTGNVNGDTFVVNGTTTATATSPVVAGGYPITPTVAGANLSSYTVVVVPGVLTITPAALTIVAPTLTKAYGAPVPALAGTYSGNVTGDTFTVTGTTTATASSPVVAGGYAITPAVTGANLANYTVVKVPGVLTIAPANLTVTVASASKVYLTPNPILTGTVTGVLPGDGITATYSTTAVTTSPVGAYAITATLNDPNGKLGNYTVSNTPSTLTITPITPVISFTAIPAAVLLGDSVTLTATLSSATGVPTGKVNFLDGAILIGSATLNTSGVATLSLTTLSAGSHTITAVYAGDTNFVTVTSGPATVLVQDFTLNIANGTLPAQTAALGGTATFSFTLTPSAATFPLPVTFSVSGLPTGATATFTPSTIASGSSATNVILSVKLPATLAEVRPGTSFPLQGLAPLSLALLSLPFLAWKRRKSIGATRLLGMFLLLVAGTVGALTMTGCGPAANMGTQTTSRSYNLTVTATEGGLSRTTTTTLNVQ